MTNDADDSKEIETDFSSVSAGSDGRRHGGSQRRRQRRRAAGAVVLTATAAVAMRPLGRIAQSSSSSSSSADIIDVVLLLQHGEEFMLLLFLLPLLEPRLQQINQTQSIQILMSSPSIHPFMSLHFISFISCPTGSIPV